MPGFSSSLWHLDLWGRHLGLHGPREDVSLVTHLCVSNLRMPARSGLGISPGPLITSVGIAVSKENPF